MTQISRPPPKHVPSGDDVRMGAPSDRALAAWSAGARPNDLSAFQMGHGRANKPTRESFEKDTRSWRCQRCLTMNRASSLSCAACAFPRAAPTSANAKLYSKPAGWTQQ